MSPSRMSRDDLVSILNAVSDAITVQVPDGALVWANNAAAALLEYPSPAELVAAPETDIAARFMLLDEYGEPFPAERLPGRLALQGKRAPETLLKWRSRDSSMERWSTVRATPVLDDSGQVRYAVNLFRDVTARQMAIRSLQRSEERLTFVALASRALLSASLNTRDIAERLTQVCVPAMGDLCAVWEANPAGRPRRLAGRVGRVEQSPLRDDVVPNSVLIAIGGEPTLTLGDDAIAPSSQVAVPILGRGGPLGAILVATLPPRAPLTGEDLEVAEELGRRAGVAIENAVLYTERAEAASVLSRSLSPPDLPEVPGLDLHAFVRAAASGVGGDFYDVMSLADGRTLLVIADVSGKGPQAAALTAMARYTLRTLARHHTSPAGLLAETNEVLLDQLPEGKFCTMSCGAFGPSSEGIRVTVVVAGHPKPLVLRRSGSVESHGETGPPVGVLYRLDLQEREVTLRSGDSFVLVTDGCVGEGGTSDSILRSALETSFPKSAQEVAALVEEVARDAQPGHPDDIAAVVARLPED